MWRVLTDPSYEAATTQILANASQEPNWVSRTEAGGLAKAYGAFLRNAEWGRLPFNEQEQSEFDRLLGQLFQKSGDIITAPLPNTVNSFH